MAEPVLPNDQPKRSPARSCLAVIAAILVYLFLSAVLFILPTGFIGPVFAIGGFFFVILLGLHYIVWGKWVAKMVAEDQDEGKEN